MTLSFTTQIIHNGIRYDFEVDYDTINPSINDIEKITMNGFPVDSIELHFSHPEVYWTIINAMKNNSSNYWSEHEPIEKVWQRLPTADEFLEAIKTICEDYNKKILSK